MISNLKTLREDRCLTQGELATLLGIRWQQTISDWERGVVRPRLRQQRALCAVLDVTIAELRAALDAAEPPARRRDPRYA